MGERTMSEHALGNKERFQLLLQQLQLIEDAVVVHFKMRKLKDLLVEKKARKWHFQFLLEKILPYNVYLRFTTQLERTFSNIATYFIRYSSIQIKLIITRIITRILESLYSAN